MGAAPATRIRGRNTHRIRRLGGLLAGLLLAVPAWADVFDDAAGTWGLPADAELTCALNPHVIAFSGDHARASFRWHGPMINYLGEVDQEGDYTVMAHGPDWIRLALDGEARRTVAGDPVVWIFRLRDAGARYCWGRTDWPADACIDRYARCPEPPPIS